MSAALICVVIQAKGSLRLSFISIQDLNEELKPLTGGKYARKIVLNNLIMTKLNEADVKRRHFVRKLLLIRNS